jgi:hypothetical protein
MLTSCPDAAALCDRRGSFRMLTNQKIVDAINEPAFAGATAWQADHLASC